MFGFWDGGWGHFTRTMALASEANDRGYEVGIITSPKYVDSIDALGVATTVEVIPNRNPDSLPPPQPFPFYSHAFRHAQRQLGLRFDDIEWLENVTRQEIEAINSFRPTVIVNDYRDTLKTAAQARSLPVVAVNHSSGNIHGKPFGWWTELPADAELPDCRDSFNEVRQKYGLSDITDERELFSGDLNIIPSIPEVDPLANPSSDSHYVGRLTRPSQVHPFAPLAASHLAGRVFSYVGEKTRPQYGYEKMLIDVISSNPNLGFYVVGEESRYSNAGLDWRQTLGRVVVSDYIPAEQAAREADIVLTHGGHETTMIALSLDTPLICVGAYHTDGSNTFKEVEKQGAGILLPHSEQPLTRRKAPDLGPDIDIFGHWHTDLTAETINASIEQIYSNPAYAENAARLGRSVRALGGATLALDIIENNFMS